MEEYDRVVASRRTELNDLEFGDLNDAAQWQIANSCQPFELDPVIKGLRYERLAARRQVAEDSEVGTDPVAPMTTHEQYLAPHGRADQADHSSRDAYNVG